MSSESIENYLTEILRLEDLGEAATTSALARRLRVAPPSVTGMLKRLARDGLIEHERYRGCRLTLDGRRSALAVIRRHRLVETFLVQALGMAPDRVHEEAHRWEHALGDEVVDRLDRWLGRPRHDPHGTVIPGAPPPVSDQVLLSTLAAGEQCTVADIHSRGPEHAAYLRDLGLVTGTGVAVTERRPHGGPVDLDIDGRHCTVGPEVTEYVHVRKGR